MKSPQQINLFPTVIMAYDLDRPLTEHEKSAVILYKHYDKGNLANLTSENSRVLGDFRFTNIKIWFEQCLHHYLITVQNPFNEGLKVKITSSWLNFTEKGGGHHRHVHPNSYLSGVFYFQTDEFDQISFMNPNLPQIRFTAKQDTELNSEVWNLPTPQNRLYIFPSTLEHTVPPKHTDGCRISLSFNTWIYGLLNISDDGVSDIEFKYG